MQAAIARRSSEGDALRARLMTVVDTLRNGFAEREIACFGTPSSIVSIR